jgi:hypothetical protein
MSEKLEKIAEKLSWSDTLIKYYAANPMEWGRDFFPHHFRLSSPEFHKWMMMDAMKERKFAVASPRQSAKSTVLVFLYPFHALMFKRKRFIVIVSNTFKKAAMHLDSIKKELVENELLKQTFPGLSLTKDAEGDSDFKHSDGFSCKILCKGVDQIGSVRGVKFGAYRPDLIIGDDMEDDELVRNPERRRQLLEDFNTALVPAGDRNICQYIFVGTILHDDAQMAKLVSPTIYKDYKKMFLQAHLDYNKPTERSLWPETWSVEFLRQLMKEDPNAYAKEYQNNPVAGTNVRFEKKDFRYWKLEGGDYVLLDETGSVVSRDSLKTCRAAIACDLAWKEKRESDSSVLLPGFITPNADILVYSYICKKGMRPDETEELLFGMVERLESLTGTVVPIGFEKAMLENVTQWLLKQGMRRRNKFITTKELVWDADKLTRIETRLQPRYCQHVIYHMSGMGELEYQLERFPSGSHDDLPDALQGLVQLLQFPKAKLKPTQADDEFMRMRKLIVDERKPDKRPHKFNARKQFPQWPVYTSWR